MNHSLTVIATISLIVAGLCAVIDSLAGHPQKMWIMNLVWPLTALYSGPIGLWAYYRVGRMTTRANVERAMKEGKEHPGKAKPFWQSVAFGATHCGSGCALGDIVAEWFIFFVPLTLFGRGIFAAWGIDYMEGLCSEW